MIKIKRVYESSSENDGFRILVDRIWPRGVSKEKADLDAWMKEIAPTNDLRKWFSHDPKKWNEFENRYKNELKDKSELINEIKDIEKDKGKVTLIYSAKDKEHNNAVVLEHTLRKL
ncbi:DUF488 domain-containing protein [Methanobacterium sp. MBAC-LM]|uniref:DUF488 domain-containing protein n=1 Tax=Methanobacterium sp. MBAC-LM TaxID=3412034 RepID=UPI003C73C1CE